MSTNLGAIQTDTRDAKHALVSITLIQIEIYLSTHCGLTDFLNQQDREVTTAWHDPTARKTSMRLYPQERTSTMQRNKAAQC